MEQEILISHQEQVVIEYNLVTKKKQNLFISKIQRFWVNLSLPNITTIVSCVFTAALPNINIKLDLFIPYYKDRNTPFLQE